ncbi:hypothetical protein [Phaeobacter sp.]|uniref:hypothetical protein n=1 Tax=Phaeobacter sp. TaxID=1902409 RepID=UPI0025F6DBCA|nr:hypothetical protein [Phaeobacter sp.]
MTDLTLVHTADVHVATIDALAPGAALTHMVRPDWLARALNGIDAVLLEEISTTIRTAKRKTARPVLCTCTTLGEVAETAGAIRLDWPMMQTAAQVGGPVLLAYCLNSTLEPSKSLLQRAMSEAGNPDPITLLPMTYLWSLFEQGDTAGFATAIAKTISEFLAAHSNPTSKPAVVVLAQASMAGAADLVTGLR